MIGIDTVLPCLLLGLTALAVIALPWFRFLDAEAQSDARYATLDGLRGVLAFSVFVFHLLITRGFVAGGEWLPPESRFQSLLGPIAVSMFFMITGFLFWGKMLRDRGRPDWRGLYVGRLFRIGPMYLTAVLAMLAIVFLRTGFELREPALDVASAVAQWLALGMIDTQPDVNGYPARHVLASVTWTIWYEWLFYGSLVLTALLARSRHHLWWVVGALSLCLGSRMLLGWNQSAYAALFAGGMLVAALLHGGGVPRMPDWLGSVLALGGLAAIYISPSQGYGAVTAVLLLVPFYCVCAGATLFGLLTVRPLRRLGSVSYSVYLVHGLVLTLVFAVQPARETAFGDWLPFWGVGLLCSGLLVLGAVAGYALVERPGIALGRRIVKGRQPPPPEVRVQPPTETQIGSRLANQVPTGK